MEDNRPTGQTTVRAVDRALDILLCFAGNDGGMSLSDIARHVGLHKSTVHRLLTSLVHKGFLRKHPQSDKYLIGWSVLELLSHIYQADDLSTIVLPEMARLRDETGESVSLYIRSNLERLRIQAVESNEPIRNVASVGKKYPLYVGASGKVLLAFGEQELVQQVLADATIPKDFAREDFLRQLDEIRSQGYAISIQERDAGAAAIAAPVFARAREYVAALSVSGPVSRFTERKMHACIPLLKMTSERVTMLLAR